MTESTIDEQEVKERVRQRYGQIAAGGGCCSSGSPAGCCGGAEAGDDERESSGGRSELGYRLEDLSSLPDGADLGLGCGNPIAISSLRPGEVVLDLGSGAGIDCFLAAKKVGASGRVIGVDMTPEMLARARANAQKGGYTTVDFRLGEIEHLPVADRAVDVVISNCVINLAPDKGQVYREAFRVLRPGGRFAVSDVVATRPIRPEERADLSLWSSCSSGALEVGEVESRLRDAGFGEVRIDLRVAPETSISLDGPASLGVVSADIRATKPLEAP